MQIEQAVCAVCGGSYDPLRTRAIAVVDGRVRAFCSAGCKERGLLPPEPPAQPVRKPARARFSFTILLVASVGLALWGTRLDARSRAAAIAFARSHGPSVVRLPRAPSHAQAMAILKPKHKDNGIWFHPLPGPHRILPLRDTRRFGAARPGLRPDECDDGHCGVDLGGLRGTPVLAVHDGVVERVERDADYPNGGRYVRINHKGGMVETSYIHLDWIPPELRPGVPVKAGEEIGTVGSTGVHHSGPHLHFAIAVRKEPGGPELYINPEPLLDLWPLKERPFLSPGQTKSLRSKADRPPGDSETL